MNIHIKVTAIIIISVITATLFMGWRLSSSLSDENYEITLETVENQAKSLRLTIDYLTQSHSEKIFSILGKDNARLPMGVRAVAILERDRYGSASVEWVKGLTVEEIEALLPELPLARVKEGEDTWMRVTDSHQRAQVASLQAVKLQKNTGAEKRIALSIMQMQSFSSVNTLFKGQSSMAMVVDHRGYALAYPEQQYLGAKVDQHTLVKKILVSQDLSYSGSFKDENKELKIGAYEKVPKTNLYVIADSPQDTRASIVGSLFVKGLLGSIIVTLLFSVIAFVILFNDVKSLEYLRESILLLGQRKALFQPDFRFPNGVNVLSVLHRLSLPESEKVIPFVEEADVLASSAKYNLEQTSQNIVQPNENQNVSFKELGFGLSRSLRGPISAILGHVQIADSKSADNSLKEHFKVIESEARKGREIIEGLARYVGDEKTQLINEDLKQLVEKIIQNKKLEWQHNQITIEENLNLTSPVSLDLKRVAEAIEESLDFLVDRMSSVIGKIIVIKLWQSSGMAKLSLRAEGNAFNEEESVNLLKPFATSRDQSPMGLSLTKAKIESSHGEMQLVSGQTEILIEFPMKETTDVTEQISNDEITNVTENPIYDEITNVTDLNIKDEITGVTENPINDEITGIMENPIDDEITGVTEDPFHGEITKETQLTNEMQVELKEEALLGVQNNEVNSPEEIMGMKPIAEGEGPDLPETPLQEAKVVTEQEKAAPEIIINAKTDKPNMKVQIRKPKVRMKS